MMRLATGDSGVSSVAWFDKRLGSVKPAPPGMAMATWFTSLPRAAGLIFPASVSVSRSPPPARSLD
ncbi:MAG: hypothetical protein EBZ36_16450 [Acidobacteria bacterium]|nr:hypothetical protein [Acidobacteriota bacterium]